MSATNIDHASAGLGRILAVAESGELNIVHRHKIMRADQDCVISTTSVIEDATRRRLRCSDRVIAIEDRPHPRRAREPRLIDADVNLISAGAAKGKRPAVI